MERNSKQSYIEKLAGYLWHGYPWI
ncbi:unnamed protein product, partial [Allacma fusca]